MRHSLYLILLVLVTAAAGAAPLADLRANDPFATPEILPVDRAFRVDSMQDDGEVRVRWQMPKGYYLYRHAFDVRAGNGDTSLPFRVPEGRHKVDEYFGEVEVYFDEVEVGIPLPEAGEISVRYQGCAEAGYCYPPQTRTIAVGN